jgi:hypothetical protein
MNTVGGRVLGYTALLITAALLVALAMGAFNKHRAEPPNSWQSPPVYPGAEQLNSEDFGAVGRREIEGWGIYVMKVMTYAVSAKNGDVEQYYDDLLRKEGWRPEDKWGRQGLDASTLNYSWSDNADPPSVYFFDVTARTLSNGGKTEVVIGASMFPGR